VEWEDYLTRMCVWSGALQERWRYHRSLRRHIRNVFGLWWGNDKLMRSCRRLVASPPALGPAMVYERNHGRRRQCYGSGIDCCGIRVAAK
jgi:hypothetical protein